MSVTRNTEADTTDLGRIETETIRLANSVVELESGPGGTIAAVRHGSGRVEYAGPLPDATVDALREVSR